VPDIEGDEKPHPRGHAIHFRGKYYEIWDRILTWLAAGEGWLDSVESMDMVVDELGSSKHHFFNFRRLHSSSQMCNQIESET